MNRPGRWRTEKLGLGDLVVVRRNGRAVAISTAGQATALLGACRLAEAVVRAPSPPVRRLRVPSRAGA